MAVDTKFKRGHKKMGGRRPGTPNRSTREARETILAICDPFEVQAHFANGVDLKRIHPILELIEEIEDELAGKSGKRLKPPTRAEWERLLAYARKTGDRGAVTQELQARAAAEISQYVAPKLRAIEFTGPEGEAGFHINGIQQKVCPKCGEVI